MAVTPTSVGAKNTLPDSSVTSRSSALSVRLTLRADDLEAVGRFLHVKLPRGDACPVAELHEHIDNEAISAGGQAAAERNAIPLADDGASRAGHEFRPAEINRARAVGGAGDEIEVADEVPGLHDRLEPGQQPLDDVVVGRDLGLARARTRRRAGLALGARVTRGGETRPNRQRGNKRSGQRCH
jgi:hypothetical protein